MHLAYIWIVPHLSAKNYRNLWKFDEVLTKTNLLSFFWDTVYCIGALASPESPPRYRGLSFVKFSVDRGVPLFNALVRGEPLNSVLRNLASRNYRYGGKSVSIY